MLKLLELSEKERRAIYLDASNKLGLPPQAIEKDTWVTFMLRMLFSSEHGDGFVFKGGTSLSKAFKLIQRFSEDVDLSIDRSILGFGDSLSKGDLRKLRRACHTYVSAQLPVVLNHQMSFFGLSDLGCEMYVENNTVTDQDPEVLLVRYPTLFRKDPYLANTIKIEVSARSLAEPFQLESLSSWIDELYPNGSFLDMPFEVKVAAPEKTVLEKLILLHEEFQKPADKVRHFRMSRHFYDIGQILNTPFGINALESRSLFESIIAHRKAMTPMRNTNYDSLTLDQLQIIPPASLMPRFSLDYKSMTETMIHGDALPFPELLNEIDRKLKSTIC